MAARNKIRRENTVQYAGGRCSECCKVVTVHDCKVRIPAPSRQRNSNKPTGAPTPTPTHARAHIHTRTPTHPPTQTHTQTDTHTHTHAHKCQRERLQGRRTKRKRWKETPGRHLQAKRQPSIGPEGNRCKRIMAVHAACTNLVRHSPTDRARREHRSGSRSPLTPLGARGLHRQWQHKASSRMTKSESAPGVQRQRTEL